MEKIKIEGRECAVSGNKNAKLCAVLLYSDYNEAALQKETALITELSVEKSLAFAALKIENPNSELSPWEAPPVFGKEGFGSGAKDTLSFITEKMLPRLKEIFAHGEETKFILGGYSLAGFFSLWAGYNTDVFTGIAAASPSVWFPSWDRYIGKNDILAKKVYLSLGDREEKTKNQVMAKVAERIRLQYEAAAKQLGAENCILEWNAGNHFAEPEVREAKAFAWLINEISSEKG